MPDSTAHAPARLGWRLFGRALLAAAPLAWIAHQVDFRDAARHAAELGWSALLAVGAPILATAIATVRWRILLGTYGAPAARIPPYRTLFRHYLVGYYYNCLPGAVAGDVLRAYRTRHVVSGARDSAAVVVAERIAGLAGLLLLGSTSLLGPSPASGLPVARALAVGALLGGTLVVTVLVSPSAYRAFVAPRRTQGMGARLDGLLRRIPTPESAAGLVLALLLSLATQAVMLLQVLGLVHALAPGASMGAVFLVMPALILLTYVPLTPGAVGQRELVYVHLLGAVGIAPERALAASFVVLAASLAAALFGGAIHLVESSGSVRASLSVPLADAPSTRHPEQPRSP